MGGWNANDLIPIFNMDLTHLGSEAFNYILRILINDLYKDIEYFPEKIYYNKINNV